MQYSAKSIEFRLGLLHKLQTTSYRQSLDFWVTNRLMDVFYTTSLMANLVEKERKTYLEEMGKVREQIIDMLDPFGPKPVREVQAEKVKKQEKDANDAANMENYLRILGSQGSFNGFGQLLTAMTALNDTVEELKKNGDDTAS